MHRLIVLVLSAVDAAIAAAVGIAATLAPLTLLWVFGFGFAGGADAGALWTAGAAIWQFGHLVPLQITLPGDFLAAAGVDQAAASFALTLAPLAFAAFTVIFAVRSGRRASQAEAWLTGVLTGTAVFAALTALIALSSANGIAAAPRWQAILLPVLVWAVPQLAGAVVTEWREAGVGVIARVRDRVEAARHGWGEVVGLIATGTAVVVTGLAGLGALLFAVALVLRGGEVIALLEAAQVDALGAGVVTLAQFAYLPTLVIWSVSFIAGPGFAVGAGTAVSPAGTQLGVVPGIPVLGVLPESTTPWLLLLALLPIGLGGLAGWICRSRLAARGPGDEDPFGARFVIVVAVAVLSGAAAGAAAALARGAIGPGRLSEVGPEPGPVALAIGVEVLIGAAILLLSPRRRAAPAPEPASVQESPWTPVVREPWAPERLAPAPLWTLHTDPVPVIAPEAGAAPTAAEAAPTAAVAPTGTDAAPATPPADDTPTADLGPRRPQPLPPGPAAPPPVD